MPSKDTSESHEQTTLRTEQTTTYNSKSTQEWVVDHRESLQLFADQRSGHAARTAAYIIACTEAGELGRPQLGPLADEIRHDPSVQTFIEQRALAAQEAVDRALGQDREYACLRGAIR